MGSLTTETVWSRFGLHDGAASASAAATARDAGAPRAHRYHESLAPITGRIGNPVMYPRCV